MKTKIDFNKVNIQNFDLQIFAAEPVQGSKIMYLVRVLEDLTKEAAMILAFQTEGSTSISKDADNVVTKSGSVRVPGGAEIEITLNALFAKGDENVKKVKAALLKDKVVEVWEINTAIEGTGENAGKYESCYYNGYITEFELTANAEDFTEYSLTVGVFGEPKDGYATLTQEQLEAAQYVFKDTVVQTSAEGNS